MKCGRVDYEKIIIFYLSVLGVFFSFPFAFPSSLTVFFSSFFFSSFFFSSFFFSSFFGLAFGVSVFFSFSFCFVSFCFVASPPSEPSSFFCFDSFFFSSFPFTPFATVIGAAALPLLLPAPGLFIFGFF
jgi:hypothetical protein